MSTIKQLDPRLAQRIVEPLCFQAAQPDGARQLIKRMRARLRSRGFNVTDQIVAECLLETVEHYQLITKWRRQEFEKRRA